MPACALCGLPTGPDPVADPAVEGEFCCRGCLAVERELGGLENRPDAGADESLDAPPAAAADADAETAYLAVSGMHCTACEAYLEAVGEETTGVRAVDASYAAETLRVAYDPDVVDREDLPAAFSGWGYEARDRADGGDLDSAESVGRLLVGGFFGMMAMVLYALFVYPRYLGGEPVAALGTFDGLYVFGNLWVFASVVLFYTGWPVLRGGLVSLRAGRPNVDLLVSLAALAAYLYGVGTVLAGGRDPYFDVSIAVVLAVSVGRHYEARIRRRAAGGLAALTELQVREARRAGDGGRVPVEEVAAGDALLVRPGERVPVDGTVREGEAAVDESLVTGEALPRRVGPGEDVRGGTVVQDAPLTVVAGEGAESTLDRIVEVVWDVQSRRPGAQRLADRLATVFVPLVLGLAALAALGTVLTGGPARAGLLTGLGVMVVSCPCALGLATPLAVAAGVSAAAERGVVVATPALFEAGAAVDTVVLDKTGTLTDGAMGVLSVRAADGQAATVRRRASALEALSAHPVGEAVAAAGDGAPADVADFERHPRGVIGRVEGERTVVGHPAFCREQGLDLPAGVEAAVSDARDRGAVPVVAGWGGRARGVLVVGDRPRPGWESVLDDLGADHRVVVLSGDEAAGGAPFGDHPAVDEVYAGVPPEGKAATVERLADRGTVAMVGDGSNDAPALGAADVGVAMAGGTQLAGDAADAMVVGDDLAAVPEALSVAAATRRRIRGNLGWALCYNLVAVPLAVAGLVNPLLAALAMTGSSLLVVANSARPIGSDDETRRASSRPAPARAGAEPS